KGLSLFIVPKKRQDENNTLISNDVRAVGIYHKMGQQSTPAMHLEFGAENDCMGYLIGEENQGMKYMFQMMNSSRLGVGLAGTYIASAAYYTSLQYAKERVQGRRLNDKNANTDPVPIIQHPDVRRLLLKQKSFIEGSLSLILQCHWYQDSLAITDSPEEKIRYHQLLELLTPVVKAYGSEEGHASVQAGLQVLGGYGYTRDFILEQLARDVRIMSIYEGTTAMQAQAVLGRQILSTEGSILEIWQSETGKDIDFAMIHIMLGPYITTCKEAIREFILISNDLVLKTRSILPEKTMVNATIYLEWFSILNLAWQWIKQAAVACKALEQTLSNEDKLFYQSKLQTMKYFFQYEFPKAIALKTTFLENETLTLFNENEILI
ncbi:MAG TPA: acyl-CoA dehydrogenase, partial [Saprospiraceae bacterium]|nr:acyl-CoA dehydrogenase [Saprospiraceae bacterium]